MNRKPFILKQHTPVIHFQPEETGATLRATELKPKLDKFLIEKLCPGKCPENDQLCKNLCSRDKIPFNWFISGQKCKALDYKVRIIPLGNRENLEESLPMFFGNQNKKPNEKKKGVYYSGKIELHIKTFNDALFTKIKEHIPEFLATTNFGTRQSKGYGSFYLDRSSPGYKDISEHLHWFNYSFDFGVTDYNDCLSNLELFYKSLRSGINLISPPRYGIKEIDGEDQVVLETKSKFYFKSLLFLYAKEALDSRQLEKKTIKDEFFKSTWHKRKLKRNEDEKITDQLGISKEKISDYVFQKGIGGQKIDHKKDDDPVFFSDDHEQKYLFKDLFGLSSLESWGSYGTEILKRNSEVSRFKSPLFFKIIRVGNGYRVYFLITKIPIEFRRANFKIESKNDPGHLNLPIYDKFDFKHFFNWIFDPKNFDITTHVRDQRMHNLQGEYGVLKSIFDQLQESPHA